MKFNQKQTHFRKTSIQFKAVVNHYQVDELKLKRGQPDNGWAFCLH